MSKTGDSYLKQQEEFDLIKAWGEYRANGGALDFTAWQEKLEKEQAEIVSGGHGYEGENL